MFAAFNIIPAGYDIDYLAQTTGIAIMGREAQGDGSVKITYSSPPTSNNFENMTDAIENYPVTYLSVALPKKISQITMVRNEKIKAFTFGGTWIELDLETKANIVGVVSGLDRNPDVPGINWSLGGGNFVFLPRAHLYALADAAFLYIQGCFTHFRTLCETAQAAANIFELDSINEGMGWPSGS